MKVLTSPGKINIGLWVIGKRADGYHNIFTFMHTVSISDRIYIKPSSKLRIRTSLSDESIQDENNIVFRAIKEFEGYTGLYEDFDVFIEKNIPLGAGLGGGSSNAAVVLKYLNQFFSNPLTEEELFEVASRVGADVPFFLKGGFALVEGKGEKITYLDKEEDLDLFLVYPNVRSDTRMVYSMVNQELLTKKEELNIIYGLQREYGLSKLIQLAKNSLGEIAKQLYPEIREVVSFLEIQGYKPQISGSGSTVYCFGEPSEAVKAGCKARNWRVIESKLI
ncbi:MAG: 4-(cytidine 5'-diphospho)-2-C-methyl-D-erythritol kinase [Hydrogenothermaceae bacterium]|nr:4-(cytidine 5'-diphospho)-2-C-methyl-D-erythritol kinase [Hydrogenothermaceae bacterium]